MSKVITLSYKITGLAAAKTLALLTAAGTGNGIQILGAMITESSNTTSQQCEACIQKVSVLGTPTGTTPTTMTANDDRTGAPTTTAVVNITASEPTYAGAQFGLAGFNLNSGWAFYQQSIQGLAQGSGFVIQAGETVGLRLTVAPGTASDVTFWITFEEL